MKRRAFFKTALALVAGSQIPSAIAQSSQKQLLILSTVVAGFQYYDGPQLDPSGHPILTLKREPDNPYDARAVALHWRHHPIGYIPRRHNHAIAQMLDNGTPMQARVVQCSSAAPAWQGWQINVEAIV